jgi:hypothetical protein
MIFLTAHNYSSSCGREDYSDLIGQAPSEASTGVYPYQPTRA